MERNPRKHGMKDAYIFHMRVFGCVAYANLPNKERTKLGAKGVKCLFLGYCEGTKAY